MSDPLQIGCIGVGGYAAHLIGVLDRAVPIERARLAAVDVSRSSPDQPVAAIMQRHGTAPVQGVTALIGQAGLDAIMVPTSIDSHLPYTAAALRAGLHVHCEKPIAATIQDARTMIAERDRAGRCVNVGFQDVSSPSTQWAKKLILDGVTGPVRRVRVMACWPRPDRYFSRNDWAGRIRRDGRWVLDSPANNALAHQINLALYLVGPDEHTSARTAEIEAELYRARDIENYDTCAIRATTDTGVELLVLLTHACARPTQPMIDWLGDAGSIHREHPGRVELRRGERVLTRREDGFEPACLAMMERFIDHLAGRSSHLLCEIDSALEVTRLVNGVSAATPVRTVDRTHVRRVALDDEPEGRVNAIVGIESVLGRCFEHWALPSETAAPWAQAPGRMDLRGYEHFDGPAQ